MLSMSENDLLSELASNSRLAFSRPFASLEKQSESPTGLPKDINAAGQLPTHHDTVCLALAFIEEILTGRI